MSTCGLPAEYPLPKAIAGDGEFLGIRAGDFDRCERSSAGETLRG